MPSTVELLERFPGLRFIVTELGAVWVPGFLQHLDQAALAFRRLQDLSHLSMSPPAYVERQVRFTPFAGEPVGWMMQASSPGLFCFSAPNFAELIGSRHVTPAG